MNEPSPAASKHTNRLAKEHSPYLLQHAHNPVDWYPWGDEAFARARREDKPIFLSVGYSTCYWCHVMERQSFENDAIAAVMNEHFVSIKVDREERPDVDQLYMTAVQVLTRHGGWPMSVWLTPDLKPFYGGTYFPPTDAHGRPGFVTVLRALADAWQNRRDDVNQSAGQITDILRQLAEPAPPDAPVVIDAALIERLVDRSTGDYDAAHGGFGSAPKFPRQTLLELLLEHNAAHPDEARLKMIRHTLDAMALGGIHDQLGGGFHRYSTDAEWLVPHFEIMLYDNAMLAWCYVEAYRQTEDLFYAEVARGIFDFVLREMTSPDGAFFTALDAEVDAREGLSYLWTRQEIESALPAEDARLFSRVYGLDRGPNFGDPHHGTGRPDRNVLFVADRAAVAPGSESAEKLRAMRQALKRVRDQRKQPMLDTKVITSWNALMIRALAFGGKILQEPRYLSAAATAADFVLRRHRMPDGRLYRASRDGAGRHHGFIDDYAFLVQALLALRDAGAGEQWKEHAAAVAIVMNQQFADVERGYYFSESGDGGLIVRQKIASDSPLPSGNAVAAMAMLALDQPGDAAGVLKVFAGQLRDQAEAMSAMVQAAGQYVRRHGPLAVEPASTSSAGQRPLSPEQIAREVVQIRTEWASPVDLSLYVDVLRGFHINGHRASPGLIATSLHVSGAEVASIDYPPGKVRRLAFAEAPIELYEGSVRVAIRFSAAPRGPVRIALAYQACDEQACLPPATKTIDVTA